MANEKAYALLRVVAVRDRAVLREPTYPLGLFLWHNRFMLWMKPAIQIGLIHIGTSEYDRDYADTH